MRCDEIALQVDDLSEEIYRRLMNAQREQGLLADAVRTYERRTAALAAKLDIAPGAETHALRRSFDA